MREGRRLKAEYELGCGWAWHINHLAEGPLAEVLEGKDHSIKEFERMKEFSKELVVTRISYEA